MKNTIIRIFLIFILFSNIIFNVLELPSFFQSWDIIFELILILILFYKLKNKSKISSIFLKSYLILLFIIAIGLLGNLIFDYASSYMAIIKDIFSFSKFPLVFLIIKNTNIDTALSDAINEKFINFIKLTIVFIFLCGIVSLFVDIGMSLDEYRHGIKSYVFLFSHPTYLVTSMVFILVLFEYKSNIIKNKTIYDVLILLIIVLTMRTKGIALVTVYILFKYFGWFLKKFKVISIIIVFLTIFLVAYSKLSLYASFSSSAREILYRGCLTLLMKCFPIGSGFGTYASHISGQYMSKVYEFIRISYVWEIAGNSIAQLGDTGYPYYIGQFGIIGIIALIKLFSNIYKIASNNSKPKSYVLLLFIYFLIALTSESTLLNFGIEGAIILSIITSNATNDNHEVLRGKN